MYVWLTSCSLLRGPSLPPPPADPPFQLKYPFCVHIKSRPAYERKYEVFCHLPRLWPSCPFPCWPLPTPHSPFRVCPVMSLASESCWAVVTGSFCYSCWSMRLLGIECSISFFSPTLQLPAMSSVFLFRSRVPLCALGWPRTRCAEFGCSFSLPLAGKKHTGTSGSVCLMVSVF